MNGRQEVLLSMLKDVIQIFIKNDIPFYSAYGTSIGALRHKGFIPWDDDVDLYIFSKDEPRIREVMEKELDHEKYFYHTPSTDTHPHVMYKGEDFLRSIKNQDAPFIDLFLLTPYPSTKFRQLLITPAIWTSILTSVLSEKVKNDLMVRGMSSLIRACNAIIASVVDVNSNKLCVYITDYLKNIYDLEDFNTQVWCDFEDTKIALPGNYDKLLSDYYGDYMTPPPEDKRSGALGFPIGVMHDYLHQ